MCPQGLAEKTDRRVTDEATQLVFAIAHEVGNHLGGIRLHAHLLDEELDARSLADASVAIDDLAGRSGPLLALLRPLLSEGPGTSVEGVTWGGLLGRVAQQVEEQGTQGVGFEVELDSAKTLEAPGFDWLHPLLIALVESTLSQVSRKDCVRLQAENDAVGGEGQGAVRLVIEDDGPEEDVSASAAYRGRPLCLALARELVGRAGGRVEARRTVEGRTRVELVFPVDAQGFPVDAQG